MPKKHLLAAAEGLPIAMALPITQAGAVAPGLNSDLSALVLASIPRQALPEGQWWPTLVTNGLMWPALATGDTAIVVPCHNFQGDGVYAFHDGQRVAFYRAERGRLTIDNMHHWPTHRVVKKLDRDGREWFAANVIGRVVASLRLMGSDTAYDDGDMSGMEGRHHV
jgi:hypothetical protein